MFDAEHQRLKVSGFPLLCCPGPLSTLKDALWAENPSTSVQLMDSWSALCGVPMVGLCCHIATCTQHKALFSFITDKNVSSEAFQ